MDYLASFAKSTSQTRVFQWVINKARSNVYPWIYNKWEANRILEDENIWLGNLESACDRKAMETYDIGRVVTAVYDINPIFPDDPGLMYLKVPVIDKPDADIAKHFNRAIEFMEDAVKNGKGVLVHCVYGVSRSSTLICAYLIAKKRLTVQQAIALVKEKRPQAEPNKGFLIQLQVLWEQLRKKEEEKYVWLNGHLYERDN